MKEVCIFSGSLKYASELLVDIFQRCTCGRLIKAEQPAASPSYLQRAFLGDDVLGDASTETLKLSSPI